MHKQEHIDRIHSIRHELEKAHHEGRPTHGLKLKLNESYMAGKEHKEVREAFRDAHNAVGAGFTGDCSAPPAEE